MNFYVTDNIVNKKDYWLSIMIKLDINKPIEYPIINLSKSENKLNKGKKKLK